MFCYLATTHEETLCYVAYCKHTETPNKEKLLSGPADSVAFDV